MLRSQWHPPIYHFSVRIQSQVMDWLAAKPDLTLAQLQARLHSEAGISLNLGRIWHLLVMDNLSALKAPASMRMR
jgi:hypothetical protein